MHKLFVYGSLKKGFGNHGKLNKTPLFEGILKGFILLTSHNFYPAITEGLGMVEGEVYEITDEQLRIIDILESHPTYYQRRTVTVLDKDHQQAHQVFTYVIVNTSSWRPYGKTNWQR